MKTLHRYIRILSATSRANISRNHLKSRRISRILGVLFVIVLSISTTPAQAGGYFYVANFHEGIWVFNHDLVYLHSISIGYDSGTISGIDFLDNGNLVVKTWDQSSGKIIIFDPAGNVISAFLAPGNCEVKGRNSDLLYTCSSSGVTEFSTNGVAIRSFPTQGGQVIALLPGNVLWVARYNAIDVFDLVSGDRTSTISLDNGQAYPTAMTYSPSTGTVLMCSNRTLAGGLIYERSLTGTFVRKFTGEYCGNSLTRDPNGDVYSSLSVYDFEDNVYLQFARWDQNGAFLGLTHLAGFYGDGNIAWAPYDNPGPQNNNSPPVLSVPSSAIVDEGGTYSFTATATDANGDSLRFYSGSPYASIDPVTGVFSWTTSESQGPGLYSFHISVVDDDILFPMTDEKWVMIRVNEVNLAPVLGAISDRAGSPRNNITFTATATDPDIPANTLRFSLIGAPEGAFIHPAAGVFTWTPTNRQTGQYTFTVRVTDNGTSPLTDDQTLTVTVSHGRSR
jgi:hypothetical protein